MDIKQERVHISLPKSNTCFHSYLKMPSSEVNLTIGWIWQLRTLFLWSDAGHATQSVTQTQLPLVLTPMVWQALGHALVTFRLCCRFIPKRTIFLCWNTSPHLLPEHPVAIAVSGQGVQTAKFLVLSVSVSGHYEHHKGERKEIPGQNSHIHKFVFLLVQSTSCKIQIWS